MFLSSLSSKATSRAPAAAARLLQLARNTARAPQVASASPSALRAIATTPTLRDLITFDCPTMGDSITEGTIVEWCIPTGSHVNEGDVIALIETDKVTVDIKAEREGVLVKHLGEADDTVEVGKGLYILDTDASAAAAVVEDVAEVNASLDATVPTESAPSAASGRVPSIHFLGKEGWKERRTATDAAASAAPSSASPTTVMTASDKPQAPTSITQMPYAAMYGRPPITDEEMEALMLGGAEEAPEVKKVVSEEGLSGVVFLGGKVVTAGPRGVWLAE